MNGIVPLSISIILSVFSTAVMGYISMATPIGPWIAPTLVLCALLLFKLFWWHTKTNDEVALVSASGSIGGILATAFGFSFPTLYFLDPILFNSWLARPTYFVTALGALALTAGSLGFWIANFFEHKLIVEEEYPFPIGQLIYKMIAASSQVRKAWELLIGFISATVFSILQDGIATMQGFVPRTVSLFSGMTYGVFSFPAIRLDIWPLLWAIGFVTGHVIALPLFVGALCKVLLLDPINVGYFPTITNMEFVLAFCSGMVLAGAVNGFLMSPKKILKTIRAKMHTFNISSFNTNVTKQQWIELAMSVLFSSVFLTYFKFSFPAQLFLLLGTFLCTYQIVCIAGKIGLAPLGRFATFVMVPALFLFNINSVHIVLIATFVEICGGVAADVLFGRKIAHLAHISSWRIKMYQLLGLIVSALTIGIVFWLLITQFGLGSEQLFAQRAQARALLVNAQTFNYWVLALGILFSLVLKKVKINPMLVLGGLLMPLNMTIGLVLGGLSTLCVKDKEAYFPFWSGVFAANSLWMLIQALR